MTKLSNNLFLTKNTTSNTVQHYSKTFTTKNCSKRLLTHWQHFQNYTTTWTHTIYNTSPFYTTIHTYTQLYTTQQSNNFTPFTTNAKRIQNIKSTFAHVVQHFSKQLHRSTHKVYITSQHSAQQFTKSVQLHTTVQSPQNKIGITLHNTTQLYHTSFLFKKTLQHNTNTLTIIHVNTLHNFRNFCTALRHLTVFF